MSFYRLSVVMLALALTGASCTCARPPVKNTLKADGEACGADEECESSLCDHLPGKSNVCFKKCAATCKAGDICTALAANDRFACVPEVPGLCQPCALNVDCPYPGDRCLEIGGTKVCSRDCSFDGQCPTSYRCADGTDTNGAYVTKQCQPTSGTCECVAASAGQTTPCSEMNSFGTCMGVRTCRPPNGYEACTAPVPTAESCNGRDDDCNGMTDENLGDTTCGIGECRRTVTNCVNGAPQPCDPLPGGTELCDEKDNDCDGLVDDGFDKQTSLTHCGACNAVCTRANATPLCAASMCRIGMCNPGFINANLIDADGCELMCTPTGAEICDGLDNDCDGTTDEGFSTSTDPTNCGLCGRVCNVNNGNISQYACVASTCGIMTCSTGFADCDQIYGTGCEKNVSADIVNCGSCNVVCSTPNGTPACTSSACAVGSCNVGYSNCDMLVPNGCEIQTETDVDKCGSCTNRCPDRTNASRTCVAGGCGFVCNTGSVNLDGDPSNGCEYACTASGSDAPELTFADSNCDGIDGDAAMAIFVALPAHGGSDSNPGTRGGPKATINAAIAAAAALMPKRAVYVSKGVYNQAVVMQPGVSVYGGYDATAAWARSLTTTTTIASGTAIGVLAQNISLPAELQLLTVTSSNASGTEANGDGRSSIGISIVDSLGGVSVVGCNVTAGNGSAGGAGPAGSTGTTGGTGGDASGINQGAGGTSLCNAPGGPGGTGVSGTSAGNGGTGGTQAPGGGAAGNPGAGGSAGVCNTSTSSNGGSAPAVTAGGIGGNIGPNGIAGAALGTVSVGGLYVPASGLSGSPGLPGGGAGGGGSGGGTANGTNFLCTNCSNISSGGGGGGGAGGCGGTTGTPGRGGGGSFAILISNSPATISNTTMRSNNGANGGSGGNGGPGGGGGPGGAGAPGGNRNNSCSNRSAGAGASGAQGGGGGQGGGASGGAGGPSICIAYLGTAPTTTSTNCSNGPGGGGGAGGFNGSQNAASGPPGTVTQLQAL